MCASTLYFFYKLLRRRLRVKFRTCSVEERNIQFSCVSLNPVFRFDIIKFFSFRMIISSLFHSSLLVVKNYKISTAYVKTRQVINSIFGIVYILVNNESSSSCVLFITTIRMNNFKMLSRKKMLKTHTRICLKAPYFPNISYISSAVILKGKLRTNKTLFTSGGRRTFALRPPC